MPVVKDSILRPLGASKEWALLIGAANQQEVKIWTVGLTDLLIKMENNHASAQVTLDIDWCMEEDESDTLISVISGATLNFGVQGLWRFSDQFFDILTDPGAVTYTPVAPYYEDVLPCNYVKLSMYGTIAVSNAKVWIQGIKRRL